MIPPFKNILFSFVTEQFPLQNIGRPRSHFDSVFNSILFILRTGCQWRNVHTSQVAWQTVHRHFTLWSRFGLFEKSYRKLVDIYMYRFGINRKRILTDTSFIKSINGTDCVGRSPVDRGRNATKLSIISDEYGVVLGATFHKANKCDYKAFLHTLHQIRKQLGIFLSGKEFYADKAYDNQICAYEVKSVGLVNKCCRRKEHNADNSKNRVVIEHVFSWLDKFRRLLLRFDRYIVHYKSFTFIGLAHRIEKLMRT